jgi:hypothetical protein
VLLVEKGSEGSENFDEYGGTLCINGSSGVILTPAISHYRIFDILYFTSHLADGTIHPA